MSHRQWIKKEVMCAQLFTRYSWQKWNVFIALLKDAAERDDIPLTDSSNKRRHYLSISMERGSSAVECRTPNREKPGLNPPFATFSKIVHFCLSTTPQFTQLYK